MTSNDTKRFSLWKAVKVTLGLSVLALALLSVPWKDTAKYRDGEESVSVEGELLGPWNSSAVSFRIDSKEELQPAWPETWRTAYQAGEPIHLVRDLQNSEDSQFDWRPGLPRVFRGLQIGPLLLAFCIFFIGITASVLRWWRLLAIAGCNTRFLSVFRLTFLGVFFNLIVPGLTGGDLMKAVMVVRENPERRADALVSAVVDRVFGLLGLLFLASAVVLFGGEQLEQFRTPVLAITAIGIAGVLLVLHPWPRQLIRLENWIHRLPQGARLKSMDRSVRIYASHPGTLFIALLISVFNHAVNATAVFIIAISIGATLGYDDVLCSASLASLISAVPVSPGGLGVEEAVYATIFTLLGSTASLGLAVGLTKRAVFTVLGLLGGIALLMPGGQALRSELKAVRQESR